MDAGTAWLGEGVHPHGRLCQRYQRFTVHERGFLCISSYIEAIQHTLLSHFFLTPWNNEKNGENLRSRSPHT